MARRRTAIRHAAVDALIAKWFRRVEYEIGNLVRYPDRDQRRSTHLEIWALLQCIDDLIEASGTKVDHPLMQLVRMKSESRLSELREAVNLAGGVATIASFSRLCREPGCMSYEDRGTWGRCWQHDWERRRKEVRLAPVVSVEPVGDVVAEAGAAE